MTRHAGLAEGSASDTAGETALPVIPFLCLRLRLSGWRSLSAKARVNLAWSPGRHRQTSAVEQDALRLPRGDHTHWRRRLAAQASQTPACGLRT